MNDKRKIERRSVNAVNILLTCAFLFFSLKFSDGGGDGGFATKINKITENLDQALLGLTDTVNYTDYDENVTYVSSIHFRAKGMAGLYNLTNMFIGIVAPKDILMDGLISIKNNQIQWGNLDYHDILNYYRSLVAIVLFLVVCAVFFPLCGICFCCCRCCGNCGARSQPADKKTDLCKKIVQGTLLIVLGTGLLFCVVCAFVSNQQLQDGVDSFPQNMENSVTDSKKFLDSTNSQTNYLLVKNYDEFAAVFVGTMNDSSDIVMEQLENYSNATAMLDLVNFTNNLGGINTTLYNLKDNTNKLRVYASQLNDALRKVRRDLIVSIQNCRIPECDEIRNNISTLQTNIDFNSLPDVSDDIASLNRLNIGEIQRAAKAGERQLNSIKTGITDGLTTGIDAAKKQIVSSGTTIKNHLKNVTNVINQVKDEIDQQATPAIKQAKVYIDEYGKYRYYVGLGISCVLLLVTFCIALGLVCGICGKRPDGYTDNCCNKGAGSQFLLCAVMIMFFSGLFVAVITLASLLVGVISDKAVCYPIKNPYPNQSRIIELLDSYDLGLGIDLKPSELLRNCYANMSVYNAFKLKSKFDLDEIRSKFDIEAQLNRLNIDGVIPKDFKILTDDNRAVLKNLTNFDSSVDFDKFTDELSTNFTNYSLSELSAKLEDIIQKLSGDSFQELRTSLQLSVLHLNSYNEKLLTPMKDMAAQVVVNAKNLDKELKMGKSSFSEAINDLINDIDGAQKILIEDGPKQLSKIAEEFKTIILAQVNGYLDRVTDHVENRIGQCGPLSRVVDATLTSTCDKILLPWNGFWFSLFWTLILYVLTIIIAIKLANLYQKYKPYGHYVETEYLYDAYADRGDSIPLNSRGGKRGRKKGKKSKRYEERPPNVGGEVVAREYSSGSHPPDGRYADMAPKFQNPYNRQNANYESHLQSTRF